MRDEIITLIDRTNKTKSIFWDNEKKWFPSLVNCLDNRLSRNCNNSHELSYLAPTHEKCKSFRNCMKNCKKVRQSVECCFNKCTRELCQKRYREDGSRRKKQFRVKTYSFFKHIYVPMHLRPVLKCQLGHKFSQSTAIRCATSIQHWHYFALRDVWLSALLFWCQIHVTDEKRISYIHQIAAIRFSDNIYL